MYQKPKEKKPATVQFRCEPEWKRQFLSCAALRGQTLEVICIDAISKYLKIAPPKPEATA